MTGDPDPLAALLPPRPPALTLVEAGAEALAGLALGLLLAALLAALIPRLQPPRQPGLRARLRADLAEAAGLAGNARLVALGRILARVAEAAGIRGADWPVTLGEQARVDWLRSGPGAQLVTELCRPNPALDPDEMRRATALVVARLARSR